MATSLTEEIKKVEALAKKKVSDAKSEAGKSSPSLRTMLIGG